MSYGSEPKEMYVVWRINGIEVRTWDSGSSLGRFEIRFIEGPEMPDWWEKIKYITPMDIYCHSHREAAQHAAGFIDAATKITR